MTTEALQYVVEEDLADQEEASIEQAVVDTWLVLENEGERLFLEAGDGVVVLADTENNSKTQIRAFDAELRPLLEHIVWEGLEILRGKISEERRVRENMEAAANKAVLDKAVAEAVEETKKKLPFLYLVQGQSGYIVVDTTWNRTLNYNRDKGVLLEAGRSNPVTFFETFLAAQAAIQDTQAYGGGNYAWSKNRYIAVPINK